MEKSIVKVEIDKDALSALATEGSKLVFRADAEEQILALLEAKEYIDGKVEELKKTIEASGLSVLPEFSGVVGDRIKAIYRYFGDRYAFDKGKTEQLVAQGLLKEVRFFKPDADAIDEHINENEELPDGIELRDRKKTIQIVVLDNKILPNEKTKEIKKGTPQDK